MVFWMFGFPNKDEENSSKNLFNILYSESPFNRMPVIMNVTKLPRYRNIASVQNHSQDEKLHSSTFCTFWNDFLVVEPKIFCNNRNRID